jgi:hypothetical protein
LIDSSGFEQFRQIGMHVGEKWEAPPENARPFPTISCNSLVK